MIFGIGTDIAKVSRFEKWVLNPKMIERFFCECEISPFTGKNLNHLCEHYAARFAAKEAFSKALGTGFIGLELKDFGIKNNSDGKPEFDFGKKTKDYIDKVIGKNWKVHISLSHEKDFAIAFSVIEVEE